MTAFKIILAVLGVLLVLQTFLAFIRTRVWWIRIFDFPRAQIAAGSIVLLALSTFANFGAEQVRPWEWVLFGFVALSAVVQVIQILPYTRIWKHQVPSAPPDSPQDNRLRIVISNVRMENRSVQRWLAVTRAARPDILVAVEVDDWWNRELEVLKQEYPHSLCQPQDNTYGMSLYSRFPLHGSEIKHLIEEDVPSIFTTVELRSGQRVRCVVLHPRPPRPDIQQDSQIRDAELVGAAQIVRTSDEPLVIAGDLNDVAWSHTTHLFQRIAGVLDPRVGRGLFTTYHAEHRLLRYPLDHVFHSNHFDLVEIRRLDHVGSDHFPMAIELSLHPKTTGRPPTEPMSESDAEQAADALDDARELKMNETAQERRERRDQDG